MTDFYVRPSATPGTYGAEDGSDFNNAWNGLTNVDWTVSGVQAGDVLKGRGVFINETLTIGASGTSGSPITLDLHGASFTNYATSSPSDWTEVDPNNPTVPLSGSNFWVLDTGTPNIVKGTAWFTEDFIVGEAKVYWTRSTAVVTDVTPANVPNRPYVFDFFKGDGGVTYDGLIGVYSEGNPISFYGAVYWVGDSIVSHRSINADNREYIHIDGGSFSKSARGIAFRNTVASTTLSGIKIQNASFDKIDKAIQFACPDTLKYIDDVEICKNTFTNCSSTGIFLSKHQRAVNIHNNTFTNMCRGYSLAAIYCGGVLGEAGALSNLIHDNEFDLCYSGVYWGSDGGGVNTDQGTTNARIYNNKFSRCWQAWHDNSGSKNYFYCNVIEDCSMVSQHTDSGSNLSIEAFILNNLAINLSCGSRYNESGTDLQSAVRLGDYGFGASGFVLENNIFTGETGNENCLHRHDNVVVGGNWNEDYNCIWNFNNEVVDQGSNPEAQGANGVNVDPLVSTEIFNDHSVPTNLNLIGAGVITSGITRDKRNVAFAPTPSIGAYELFNFLNRTDKEFFVRPSTTPGTYGDEDGRDYDNAWNGFVNVSYGTALNQFGPGDTLWLDSAATYLGEILEIGSSGTSAGKLKIDGSYGGNGRALIDANSAVNNCIRIFGKEYLEFKNLRLTGALTTSFNSLSRSTLTNSNISVEKVSVYNNAGSGIAFGTWTGEAPPNVAVGNRISECHAYNNGGHGLAINGWQSGAIIEKSLSHGNSTVSSGWNIYMNGWVTIDANGWSGAGPVYSYVPPFTVIGVEVGVQGPLTDAGATTTPAAGQFGQVAGTLYVRLIDSTSPDTKSMTLVYGYNDGGVIKDNESYSSSAGFDGVGIGFDIGTSNGTIERCYSHDEPNDGIQMNKGNGGHVIKNNISVNNGRYGIRSSTPGFNAVTIANNTCEGNITAGVAVQYIASGITINSVNNINSGGQYGCLGQNVTGSFVVNNCCNYNNSLAAISGSTGGTGSITSNPELDSNYRPTNEALIGAGVDVSGVDSGFAFSKFDSPPSIGASSSRTIKSMGVKHASLFGLVSTKQIKSRGIGTVPVSTTRS